MEQLILVIVIGVIGLVKWIIENRGKFSESKEDRRDFDRPPIRSGEHSRPARGAETPEEERMRRFMEALGLPPGSTPPPTTPRANQPKVIPPPVTVEEPEPAPQIPPPVVHPRSPVEPKRWGNHPAPPKEKSQPQPSPVPRRAAMPTPKPVGSPVPMPAPKPISTAGAAPFRPLEAFPEIPDAAPTSSVAPPMEIASLEFKPNTSTQEKSTLTTIDSLRGELRDPAAARRAFVLREVLGPPVAMKP